MAKKQSMFFEQKNYLFFFLYFVIYLLTLNISGNLDRLLISMIMMHSLRQPLATPVHCERCWFFMFLKVSHKKSFASLETM